MAMNRDLITLVKECKKRDLVKVSPREKAKMRSRKGMSKMEETMRHDAVELLGQMKKMDML